MEVHHPGGGRHFPAHGAASHHHPGGGRHFPAQGAASHLDDQRADRFRPYPNRCANQQLDLHRLLIWITTRSPPPLNIRGGGDPVAIRTTIRIGSKSIRLSVIRSSKCATARTWWPHPGWWTSIRGAFLASSRQYDQSAKWHRSLRRHSSNCGLGKVYQEHGAQRKGSGTPNVNNWFLLLVANLKNQVGECVE